jgi:hypothetical protein
MRMQIMMVPGEATKYITGCALNANGSCAAVLLSNQLCKLYGNSEFIALRKVRVPIEPV